MKKNNKSITIGDIAKELGVSTALVSMVLSGKGKNYRISKKASDKVFKTAKRLGYMPNYMAKALRTGKSNVLGLIVADIANPFFARIARLIENEADRRGYQVMFASSDEDIEKFKKLGDTFIANQVDGLLIVPVKNSQEIIKVWHSSGIPIVFIDRYFTELDISYAVTDNFNASFQLLEFILSKGYKKIAFISKESNVSSFIDREEGFMSGVRTFNLKSKEYSIFRLSNNDWESGLKDKLQEILYDRYDIIYFTQNMLGVIGLKILIDLNVKIPEDIAVISFDNPDVFRFNNPTITCYEQPLDELSTVAFSCISKLIEDDCETNKICVKLKGEILVRESC